MAKGKWTDSEIAFLKASYFTKGVKYCAGYVEKSVYCCYAKAKSLGICKQKRYTEEEIKYIIENYASMGATALSKKMNRSKNAIRNMGVRLGLTVSKKGRSKIAKELRSRWTEQSVKTHAEKISRFRGEMNPSWKGGVSQFREYARGRLHHAWGKYVFERDSYICRLCGESGGKMVGHHVRTFTQIRDAVLKEHPELNPAVQIDKEILADLVVEAHQLKDGITLCRSCHKKHHLENGVNCGDILPGNAGDNPQPSRGNVLQYVPRKVQRLTLEDTQTNKSDTSAPPAIPTAG